MNTLLRRSSTYLIIAGILAIIFGVIAMFYPVASAATLVIVWGIYALADGIFALVSAFRPAEKSGRAILIIVGILGVLAGIIAVTQPLSSLVALTWVLGVWFIARGILDIVSAFTSHADTPRWLLVLVGVLWLIAGILIAMAPGAAAVGFSLWLGILAVIWGGSMVAMGAVGRSEARESAKAAA